MIDLCQVGQIHDFRFCAFLVHLRICNLDLNYLLPSIAYDTSKNPNQFFPSDMGDATDDPKAHALGSTGPANTKMTRKINDSSEIFDSGFLSDCTVRCGKKVWRLHKIILCSRSKFFKAALTGNFEVGARCTCSPLGCLAMRF